MAGTPVVPTKQNDVVWKKMGDECILLGGESENYYSLNDVGARIWELVDGQRSNQEIAALITEEYEVSTEQAQSDVDALLGELHEQGLLI